MKTNFQEFKKRQKPLKNEVSFAVTYFKRVTSSFKKILHFFTSYFTIKTIKENNTLLYSCIEIEILNRNRNRNA